MGLGVKTVSAGWARRDTVGLVTVTLVAALLRLSGLTETGIVFDETYYVRDACAFVNATPECVGADDDNAPHPPMGIWAVAFGIKLLGFGRAGWRVAPLAAGTLTVALLYLLARRVVGSTLAATVAAGLLAVDFLHFVHSRLAMLDVFLALFAVAAFLFVTLDRPSADRRVLRRPWLLLAGLACGAAVATKWAGLPIALGVAGVALARALEARPASQSGLEKLRDEALPFLVAFGVVPALVYVGAHAGRIDGQLLALPWTEGSWVRAFLARQATMLEFHRSVGGLGDQNPYTSPALSWLLVQRPVLYMFELQGGHYREILALGNPLVWWASLAALVTVVVRGIRVGWGAAQMVVAVGFGSAWVPWLLVTAGRSYAFLFYLLPAVPFMMLALGYVADVLYRAVPGRAAVAAFAAMAVSAFAFYHPLLAAKPLSPAAWERRILFGYEACGIAPPNPPGSRQPNQPLLDTRKPPKGWCWI